MSAAKPPVLVFALDQLGAALVIVEALRAVPWQSHPSIRTVPDRGELDGELAKLRAYLVDATEALQDADLGVLLRGGR